MQAGCTRHCLNCLNRPTPCIPPLSRPSGKYIINGELMKLVKQDAVVMHPLPRVDEVGMPCCALQ